MDGIHDLGGKHGFGSVEIEPDEPTFHADWEARVFTLLGAAWGSGALKNVDQFRHAIERIAPAAYLTHGYYGRWLGAIETVFVEAGILTRDAIDAEDAAVKVGEPLPLIASQPAPVPDVISYSPATRSARREQQVPSKFHVGDEVRTRASRTLGHTRLPGYAQRARGVIAKCHDTWLYPDSNAHGHGEDPQHLYTVRFDGETLFGASSEPGVVVYLDLFEPYLELL
jgi:nitrile hydratase beta subunit